MYLYQIPKIDELIEALKDNYEEAIKSYDNIITLNSYFKREIMLGDIDAEVGEAVEAYIRFFNSYDEENKIPIEDRLPIKIYIDSGGGDLCATLTMIDAIRMSKTPIWTINVGAAYSGGFFVLLAGHKRFGYAHSSYLFHEGSAQNGGTSGQFENFSGFYRKQLEQLKNHVLQHTKITEEEYEKIKRDDIWYEANEALKKGIIDEITTEFI